MKSRDLSKFFNPKSIAVVGASSNKNKVGGILMKKLEKFRGKIIPINIKDGTIFNKKVYKSILDYENQIDLVVIAIPSKFVKEVLNECVEKKVKNVIVISAGFSESGNKKEEQELVEIARKNEINLLGPNCFGIANPYLDLDTTFANCFIEKGDTAFISQSGALASYVFDKEDSKLSGFVSLGNMADLEFNEWLEYFEKDSNTKKIVLYVEKVKQGKKFIEVCKKSKKEIIVIKAGKTEEGSKAAFSHTGSLATEYDIYRGVFRQCKVKIASSIFSAFNYIKLNKIPKDRKIKIITNAGGAGALMSDACVKRGLEIIGKPLDILGDANAGDYKKALKNLKNNYDSLIVILTPQAMSQPEQTAKEIIKFAKNKTVVACFLGEKSMKSAKNIFKDNNILCFNRINEVADVLSVY